jgi:chromosome segregation ATPase
VHKTLPSLVLVAGIVGLTACDDAGRQQTALQDAIQQIQVAERGFVAASDEPVPLMQHRRENLEDASRKLRSVVDQGTAAQQTTARRLLADLASSLARMDAQQAAAAYGEIAPESVQLVSLAMAADRAAARAQLLDQRQPAVIEALRTQIREEEARLAELRASAEQTQRQIDGERAALERIENQRDQAMARAQELRSQAFVAEGAEGFRLADDAAAVEREGTIAAAEGDRRQLTIDMLQSQLSVVESQLRLTTEVIEELNSRVAAAQRRQGEIEQASIDAIRARDEQIAALSERLGDVLSAFRERVDGRLQQASQRLGEAVQHLQAAEGGADRDIRDHVQLDLLTARAMQVHLYAEHLMLTAAFHDLLRTLQQSIASLDGVEAPGLAEAVQQLAEQRTALAAEATQAIQSGQQLAAQLANAPESVASVAAEHTRRLAGYQQRLQAAGATN